MRIDATRASQWLRNAIVALAPVFVLALSITVTARAVTGSSIPSSAASTAAAKPYHLPPEKLAQATALGQIRTSIHFGAELWNLAVLYLLIATGTASRIAKWTEAKTHRNWLQAGIYSAILVTLIFLIVEAPIGAIAHAFSRHYGISIEGWNSWLLDEAKSLGLTILIETPLLMLAFSLLQWSPRRYWLWFSAAVVPLMLLGTFLLPPLIEPLFNTFEPLTKSHPALVTELERVVARTGTSIPPERMFLMKASEKSNGLNAYVTGIGASKRIVVWDTTADRMPKDEILFTFAHESGHYVLNHIPKGLTLAAIGMLFLFGATAALANWLVRRRGITWQIATVSSLPGLVIILLVLAALQIVTEPIENTISRHFEHEADVYGQEAIHGIVPDPQKTAIAAFNDLGEAYLDDPNPNPFLEFWTYDHPSIQTRAIFASQYNPWTPEQKPKFFPRTKFFPLN